MYFRRKREGRVKRETKDAINGKVSKNPEEWPDDLRVREYPR